MVARNVFGTGETHPTEVKRNKDGSVEFPNDPHIQQVTDQTGPRPQTQHSGYAQGGTTNPPVGESGEPVWYSPDGKVEETPEKMFERDAEVNPRGDGHGAATRFEGDFGTVDEPVYVESSKPSKKDS